MPRRASPEQMQARIARFNTTVKVGDQVRVQLAGGTIRGTKTLGPAFLQNGNAVVLVDLLPARFFLLENVTPGGFGHGEPRRAP